jgi:hypothetical protein
MRKAWISSDISDLNLQTNILKWLVKEMQGATGII